MRRYLPLCLVRPVLRSAPQASQCKTFEGQSDKDLPSGIGACISSYAGFARAQGIQAMCLLECLRPLTQGVRNLMLLPLHLKDGRRVHMYWRQCSTRYRLLSCWAMHCADQPYKLAEPSACVNVCRMLEMMEPVQCAWMLQQTPGSGHATTAAPVRPAVISSWPPIAAVLYAGQESLWL